MHNHNTDDEDDDGGFTFEEGCSSTKLQGLWLPGTLGLSVDKLTQQKELQRRALSFSPLTVKYVLTKRSLK